MTIRDIIKLFFKVVISIYIASVIGYIIFNVGSDNKDYFVKAFSPGELYNKIVSGDISFIMFIILATAFLIFFNILKTTKVNYWAGAWWRRGIGPP